MEERIMEQQEPDRPLPRVIVVEKKKKHSKNLKNIQTSSDHLVDASYHMARSITKGMAAYRKKSKASSKKKKDGVVKDFIPNVAAGISEALKRSSKVPIDLAKATKEKSARRFVKRLIRIYS